MLKKNALSLGCLFSLVLGAANAAASYSVETQFVNSIAPRNSSEPMRFMSSEDGLVYLINPLNVELFQKALSALSAGDWVKVTANDDRYITGLRVVATATSEDRARVNSLRVMDSTLPGQTAPVSESYQPTEFGQFSDAEQLFDLQVLNFKGRSQCYQRAHVWAYQLWNSRLVKTQKVFMFYTQKYIREYNFKWWFHVAPFVIVNGREVVIDPTFLDAPKYMRDWTDFFMYNKAECGVAETYAQGQSNDRYCWIRKVPMYYYQPLDVEARDEEGKLISGFRQWDIEHSRRALRGVF